MRRFFLILLFAGSVLAAAPNLNVPIAELKLNDGRVLKNVQLVSYAASAVMAKWDGGRGTIKYEDFPEEYQAALAAERPSPPTAPAKKIPKSTPGPSVDMTPLTAQPLAAIAPQQQLAGQCFIATRGGTSFKLGLVEVAVYPKAAFDAYEAEILKRFKGRLDYYLARKEHLQMSVTLHHMWSLLPAATASTQTDADGKFSLTHTVAPPFVVFARASRRVTDKTEYYCWRVSSDKIRNPAQLFLSNDNMD